MNTSKSTMNPNISTISYNNQKSATKMVEKKSPIDLHYMRRVSVRHQKKQLISIKLAQFPTVYFIGHCVILASLAIIYFVIQIVLIVKQTPLFYVCTGFWMALIYIGCIYSVFVLGKFILFYFY